MQTWLDNGAKLAWLVDPIAASVTIYRPGRAPETLDRPEIVKGEAPVDGFELRCTRLWA
jgi:Uma2 family endonuclease